jgi:hypothetical protein
MAWTQNNPPLASADLFSIPGNGKSPRKLQSARIKIEPEWCVRYAIRDRVHQELLPIVRNDVLLFGDALHSSAEVRQNAIKMDVEQLLTGVAPANLSYAAIRSREALNADFEPTSFLS